MTSYINIKKLKRLALVLGNQLFPINQQNIDKSTTIFMCEDYGLCTYEKHHKLKIYLYLCAMREYKDELQRNGIQVDYFSLDDRSDKKTYIEFFLEFSCEQNIDRVNIFEIELTFLFFIYSFNTVEKSFLLIG